MKIVRTKEALKDAIRACKSNGKTIGLVPTMGALHAGHISLVEVAKQHASAIVATIFVNPTQFGPNEDFSRYPRTEDADTQMLKEVGTEIVYIPTVEEMYPKGAITKVTVPGISTELCGAFRPGHFDGVATIVTKLFMQVAPDVAVFGEKDYQQLHIIRQCTRDLDVPVEIIGAPTLREEDGLAMSSRNRYLSDKERSIAASLYKTLQQASDALGNGQESNVVLLQARQSLLLAGFTKVDYVELRDAGTLAITGLERTKDSARLLAAAWLTNTRLIDNIRC